MPTLTSIPGGAIKKEDLVRILADYLALDRARAFRRRQFKRFGPLAAVAFLLAMAVHGTAAGVRWLPLGLTFVPPAWAWIAEFRIERRIALKVDEFDGVSTRTLPELAPFHEPD